MSLSVHDKIINHLPSPHPQNSTTGRNLDTNFANDLTHLRPENGFSLKMKMGEEKGFQESKGGQNSPESSAGKPSIQRAIELISSLISLSHSIKVFSVKWQSIRIKLEELLSGLTAVQNCDSGDNPSLSGTVQRIIDTLTSCYDLARRCVDLSFSGKLLMQSDLDILSAKFDSHTKSLSEIYTAGLLSHNYAIVVSRPSLGASRDDMKFYVRDLLSRMRIGGTEMKKQALIAFNEVIDEDEKYVKVAVEIGSLISLLVKFLDSQETQIQSESARAVSIIAGFDSYRNVLIGAGVIAPLIRVLESGDEFGKEWSARCLQKLTENSDNAWSISAHGGVTALLKICSDCDFGVELVGLACGVLKNLVGVEEIKRFMVEDGAISVFIKLVRSKDELSQISSMDFLQSMACGDEFTRQMIVREGGVRVLVRVLDPISTFSLKAREMALRAIVNLCFSCPSTLNILMNYGFLDHIAYFLRNGEVSIQELALKVSVRLCGTSIEAKKEMGDAGFMPELVKLLEAKSFEVREMAAEALSSMILLPKNRKRFVHSDQNVGLLLQMLNPEEGNSSGKKFLLSALMSLSSSNSGRKKIVSSGYVKNIEKLAEAQVSDAKKIVRKLSSSRLRSLFSGIWFS
ncbi:vacuolar protein 8 [Cornus florida]|uniref:vacuolar protein 8 n=1 Tax=Cornus florida TaxID=4283 RepID=UPI0028972D94|nr:vacuolar protein 8 [Cornus florida]